MNRSYWPDTEATGQLLTTLCEGLASHFDVHVVAGLPNSVVGQESAWQEVGSRRGVTIHRVRHLQLPKNRLVWKATNFLSFALAAERYIRRLPRPDVVVFETDPFLLPFVADRLRRHSGCRMVGYLQDIYPDVAVALGKIRNSWPVRRLRAALFRIYARCDRLIVLSRDMRQLLVDSSIAAERIQIIPNWADTELLRPVASENTFRQQHGLQGRFVVMYSGNLGLTQRLEDFVEAAALLQQDPDIRLVLIGRGAQRDSLMRLVASRGLQNVMFLDYQPAAELHLSLGAADLHLLPLNAVLTRCLMPSKLYGILAAGRPCLTNAPPESELYGLIRDHDVGLTVPPDSPQLIADAISAAKACPQSLQRQGENARRLAEARFSRAVAVEAFQGLLDEILQDLSSQCRPVGNELR